MGVDRCRINQVTHVNVTGLVTDMLLAARRVVETRVNDEPPYGSGAGCNELADTATGLLCTSLNPPTGYFIERGFGKVCARDER